MKTTAAVLHAAGGPLELTAVELAEPGPGQVLVRVRATGVCASDLHIVEGRLPKPLPIVPGHEAAGEVVGLGAGVDDLRPGANVVLSILPRCSACTACRSGRTAHCAWGGKLAATGTLDGISTAWRLPDGSPLHHFNGVSSFSEYVVVPRSGAIEVDPAVPFTSAALLGCAVMTGVGSVRNAARVAPGQTVAVIGCGGVGLNVVQGARMAGAARIVAVDVDDAKLALARRIGATDTLDARDLDVPARVMQLVPGGVDHAFDAIGRPAALQDAYAMLAGGGTAVAVGLFALGDTVTLPAFPLIGERRIVGTYMGGADPHVDIPLLAADVLEGSLRLDELIVERPFAEVDDAIDDLRRGRSLARQVLTFEE